MHNVKPRVLVLTGYGINCDYETEYAFNMPSVGGEAERVHLNDLIAGQKRLSDYEILAIPGGFSFGDDIASGKVFANKLRFSLREQLASFVNDGKLIIGICNGFQVLVKCGLLPGLSGMFQQEVTLTFNDSGKFEDRWVHLKANPDTKCVFLRGVETLYLPVRHGEGKFVPRDGQVLEKIRGSGLLALQYVGPNGQPADYPWNPNGSVENIAGICDTTGRIFGLMPHPEAYLHPTNHPRWTREPVPEEGMGVAVFRNAVRYFK